MTALPVIKPAFKEVEDWKQEMLSRLSPKSVHVYEPGDIEWPNAMDVAGMMAGCDPRHAALLLAKYAHDKSSFHKVWAYWFAHVMQRAIDKEWELRKSGMVEGFATVTLREHISPNLCGRCNGVGSRHKRGDIELKCIACDGTGKAYFSGREIARKIGFKKGSLRAPWTDRLFDARRELRWWEIQGLREIY